MPGGKAVAHERAVTSRTILLVKVATPSLEDGSHLASDSVGQQAMPQLR